MEENYKDAIKWLDLAAEKGDAEAQFKLGKILSETGAKYLSASIKQGYKDAIEDSPNIVKLFKDIAIVEFGSYPFDKQGNVRPIEWWAIDVKDNKALLITKYGIDCKPYNEKHTDITWEHCYLRQWLNNQFYNRAFSEEEKATIVETLVKAQNSPEIFKYPGNDTRDKVFLLSMNEAKKFLSGKGDRKCVPTEYAKENRCWENTKGLCWWWLRSHGMTKYAACVTASGSVNCGGEMDVYDANFSVHPAVRPALWVNLSSL